MKHDHLEPVAPLSPSCISSRFWTFGLASGDLFARNVVLSESGSILHYENPNEKNWAMQDQIIILTASDGRISAKLEIVPSDTPGRIRFEGEHLLGGPSGIFLALQETPLTYPVYFNWSLAIERFIRKVPFYLAAPYQIHNIFHSKELVCIAQPIKVEPYASLPKRCFITMGAFSYCHGSFADAEASIGRYCSIAAGARPFGPSHPMERISTALFSYDPHYIEIARQLGVTNYATIPFNQDGPKVVIEHDVWIGEEAMIKRGVTIGTGSVVGARSVVTRNVPPYSVVAGMPAKVIRQRFSDTVSNALLASHWWEYRFCDLPPNFQDPLEFTVSLRKKIENGAIQPWTPDAVDVATSLLRIPPDLN